MPSTTSTNHGTLALLRDLVPRRQLARAESYRIAELQASRLRRHLGVGDARFPIETIAELPRIEVRYDADLNESGMSFWNGHDWIILINPTESPTRQRFTQAHEFKHIVDHTTKRYLYGPAAATHNPLAERVADYFAACVLMPKPDLKRIWGEGPRLTTSLADRFSVSTAAMRYRLNELGLTNARRCGWSQEAYRRHGGYDVEMAA